MGRPQYDNNPEGEQFRKMFIGGLDYRTTDQSLKSYYETWGEIVDVVVMKHPQTQKSRGFGFVTYAKSSMVDEAMQNRPHKIDGRVVDSKRAVPRDEGGAQSGANVNVKKMFVGGIKEQTEEDIRSYFGTFGTIVSVSLPVDKQSGKRKGFAFIEFDDYDPVDKALLIKNHQVDGKSVTVKKAVVKDGSGAPGGRGGRGGRGASGGRGGVPSSAWGASAGSQWGANGYAAGPWDTQANGWGGQWDQYGSSSGWGADSYSSYGAPVGGGPIRSNYSGNTRNAPYGGGGSYGGSGRY